MEQAIGDFRRNDRFQPNVGSENLADTSLPTAFSVGIRDCEAFGSCIANILDESLLED
jgi:hypothetical protein